MRRPAAIMPHALESCPLEPRLCRSPAGLRGVAGIQTAAGLLPGALGSRPVIVISHGVATGTLPPAFERGWAASQARLARWSRSGIAVTAKGAGHEVAEEAPVFAAQWVRRAYAQALEGAGPG